MPMKANGIATQRVSYAGLNLDSDVGAKVFYSHLQSAANSVCSGYDGCDLTVAKLLANCLSKEIASAVSQANNSKVTGIGIRNPPQ